MPMVDIDWLKEHVEVPSDLTYEQLAKDLVRVGLEEEEIHSSQVTGPIVVGYVVDATPEPQKNGKTINWCHVDVGPAYNAVDENGKKVPRGIICGAPNMAAGEKVVVTLPGAVLPGDFKIEPRKTYGHVSDGMCASERELGLGDSHEGIILLRDYGFTPQEYKALKPGDDAMHLLHLDQPILEINITPDRGYAFSYRGVARESRGGVRRLQRPRGHRRRQQPDSRSHRLRPLRRPRHPRVRPDESHAELDAPPSYPRGHAFDLPRRGCDELRDAGPWPADARLRP